MKNKLLTTAFLLACFTVDAYSFATQECSSFKSWSFLQTSEGVRSPAMSDLDKDKITLGQPFSFKVALCDTKSEKPDRVTASAIMPAHQHGMNYAPTVTYNDKKGTYTVDGFLFHMPGLWEVNISTYNGDESSHYTQKITVN